MNFTDLLTTPPLTLKLFPNYNAAAWGLPSYQTQHSAAFDLPAAIGPGNTVTIQPGETVLIPTGLGITIDPTHPIFTSNLPFVPELQLRPRSGNAARHGLTLVNTPGTIDADYQDEIKLIVLNTGKQPFTVEDGMRMAQGVVALSIRIGGAQVLSTARQGGFGSTGQKQAA